MVSVYGLYRRDRQLSLAGKLDPLPGPATTVVAAGGRQRQAGGEERVRRNPDLVPKVGHHNTNHVRFDSSLFTFPGNPLQRPTPSYTGRAKPLCVGRPGIKAWPRSTVANKPASQHTADVLCVSTRQIPATSVTWRTRIQASTATEYGGRSRV